MGKAETMGALKAVSCVSVLLLVALAQTVEVEDLAAVNEDVTIIEAQLAALEMPKTAQRDLEASFASYDSVIFRSGTESENKRVNMAYGEFVGDEGHRLYGGGWAPNANATKNVGMQEYVGKQCNIKGKAPAKEMAMTPGKWYHLGNGKANRKPDKSCLPKRIAFEGIELGPDTRKVPFRCTHLFGRISRGTNDTAQMFYHQRCTRDWENECQKVPPVTLPMAIEAPDTTSGLVTAGNSGVCLTKCDEVAGAFMGVSWTAGKTFAKAFGCKVWKAGKAKGKSKGKSGPLFDHRLSFLEESADVTL